jgi:CheY-like chemotaxis protein
MRRSVWVVDDEPLVRAAVCAMLAELGYDARGIASAEELRATLDRGGKPDLVVLDHMLPDENGAAVLRTLREQPAFRELPVVFLTAISDEQATRLSEMAPVIRKPFDFREFTSTIESLVPLPAATKVT